jgi:hypothetical protein
MGFRKPITHFRSDSKRSWSGLSWLVIISYITVITGHYLIGMDLDQVSNILLHNRTADKVRLPYATSGLKLRTSVLVGIFLHWKSTLLGWVYRTPNREM